MNALHAVPTLKAHIALNVADVERSTTFYSTMFGVEPSKVRPGYAKFDLDNPPLNLTLNQGATDSTGALSHLGIQVPSTAEVDAIRDEWQRAGLLPRDEKNVACCYAVQDKAWVNDPDGNEWEVFTVLGDAQVYSNTPAGCCAPTHEASQNLEA